MRNLHQIFHVIALVGFLGAVATAFLGLAAPLLFIERSGIKTPALRTAFLLLLAAGGGLTGDWVVHHL